MGGVKCSNRASPEIRSNRAPPEIRVNRAPPERPREVIGGPYGGPWRSLGCSRVVLGGPWGSLGESQGALKTEVVLWGRPGMVLGGPWGGFEGMGRSLGQSWEVRMLLFLWF